jgi:uncharacterized phage protein (TIGR01671 family)
MTREIKFRAWHPQLNKMFYDCNVSSQSWTTESTHFGGDYKTLMQYTGLHDSKGVEIYDGDIVTYIQELREYKGKSIEPPTDFVVGNYEVGWNEIHAMWGLQLRKEWPVSPGLSNTRVKNGKDENIMEVVGNIFENPQLFKEIE